MSPSAVKTPFHLWIVAILAVLWNAIGAYDYIATQYRIESYMSKFTAEQLEYFYAFPTWMDAAWAVGIWGSVLGSLFLLFRNAWAIFFFGASILGLAVSSIYNFVLSDGLAVMGEGAGTFTAIIWAVALFLLYYSKAMIAKKVLN